MDTHDYVISDEVFQLFPGYVRGVVLAYDVQNHESSPELVASLREAEEALRGRLEIGTLVEDPHIKSWREAYRSFGAKPSEFRSSIEAMARRVLRGEPLPSINALVDIGNILSLRYLVPTGGHAIDALEHDMALRRATGTEEFVPFGSDQMEHPLPGEIIFAEGDQVLTRRWTWRQAVRTLTLPETTAIEFNVDGLPPVTVADVEAVCGEVMRLVEQHCGGRTRYAILTRANPRLRIGE